MNRARRRRFVLRSTALPSPAAAAAAARPPHVACGVVVPRAVRRRHCTMPRSSDEQRGHGSRMTRLVKSDNLAPLNERLNGQGHAPHVLWWRAFVCVTVRAQARAGACVCVRLPPYFERADPPWSTTSFFRRWSSH